MEPESLLGTLGIDWKLFLAQLVNFGIVLFVFWKWVVKPLGKTLAERQKRIETGLQNADLMTEEKKKVRLDADKVLRLTNDSANQIKQETIVDAQKQAAKVIEQAKISIESEK